MTENARRNTFWGILGGVFCMMLLLNGLTPMHVDDYTFAFSFATGERITSLAQILPSCVAHFWEWNGRILTNCLPMQLLMWAGKPVFNVVSSAMYVLFSLGLYFMVGSRKKHDWVLLLAIQACVFLFAPVFGVTVLWASGACNYLWGTTAILFVLLPFRNAVVFGEAERLSAPKHVWLALGALVAGNSIENTSFAMIGLMFLSILWLTLRKKRIPLWMISSLVLALMGYGVMLLAPSVGSNVSGGVSLGRYLGMFALCMSKLLDIKGILCVYAILAVLAWREPEVRGRLVFSGMLALGALIANVMMVFPSYYPGRATFGWVFFWLAACGLLLPSLPVRWAPLWHGAVAGLALLAVITLFQVLPKNYDRYRQTQAQAASIAQQRDAGQMNASIFWVNSKSDYDWNCDGVALSNNPQKYRNLCMARYYGVETLTPTDEAY